MTYNVFGGTLNLTQLQPNYCHRPPIFLSQVNYKTKNSCQINIPINALPISVMLQTFYALNSSIVQFLAIRIGKKISIFCPLLEGGGDTFCMLWIMLIFVNFICVFISYMVFLSL